MSYNQTTCEFMNGILSVLTIGKVWFTLETDPQGGGLFLRTLWIAAPMDRITNMTDWFYIQQLQSAAREDGILTGKKMRYSYESEVNKRTASQQP